MKPINSSGWTWDTVGSIVTIHPTGVGHSGSRVECCDSLGVTICTDCAIATMSWTTNWSNTDTCGNTFMDTVSYNFGEGGEKQIEPQAAPKPNQQNGSQNFPNPFGTESGFQTTIPFTTTAAGVATIRIVDEKGNIVLTQDEEVTYVGTHFFYFTGKDLPTGTYYYQIEFPKGVVIVSRSMLLVK